VDGFSGPWKSADEDYEDTSFVIALKQLRKVRDGLSQRRRNIRIRCLFNDNDSAAYEGLKKAVASVSDIEIKPLCRDFEEVVPDIVGYVGRSFSLTFIDPTGWTGFGLEKIRPLLQLRGEVIINFMFDFVNRFLEEALETPLVWESDVKEWLREMRKNGEIEVQGLTGRETTPKVGHRILWKKAHSPSR
jgi:three-Cys-motif partner protein